jgi:two-component system response regulator BaeR
MPDSSHPPILVVDDNPDNAHIIRDYLEARGYPITVAYNGDDAMKAFEEVKPALVLLGSAATSSRTRPWAGMCEW